jgi:hypothetical protein
MRTTLVIDDHIFRLAKKRAVEEGKPLRAVVEDALRQALLPAGRPKAAAFRLRVPTVRGRALPGVDFADRDAVYERMEGRG